MDPIVVEIVGETEDGAVSATTLELPMTDSDLLNELYSAKLSPVSALIGSSVVPEWLPKGIDCYDDVMTLNAVAKIAEHATDSALRAAARFADDAYSNDYVGLANVYLQADDILGQQDREFPEIERLIETEYEAAALGRRFHDGIQEETLGANVEAYLERKHPPLDNLTITGAKAARNKSAAASAQDRSPQSIRM